MTDNDIIRIAHEAGWQYADGDDGYDPLWKFGELVAAAEREACAQIAAWILKMPENDVSAAIRARGQG